MIFLRSYNMYKWVSFTLTMLLKEKITRQYLLNYIHTHVTTIPSELHTELYSLRSS